MELADRICKEIQARLEEKIKGDVDIFCHASVSCPGLIYIYIENPEYHVEYKKLINVRSRVFSYDPITEIAEMIAIEYEDTIHHTFYELSRKKQFLL